VNAVVHRDINPVGLEDLLNNLARVRVQVKAVNSCSRLQFHRFAGCLFTLLVDGPWLAQQGIVSQLEQVLLHLGVARIEFERMGQGRSRLRCIAAQPVLGRCLNQRRHRVTASDTRRQRVVGIAWVERGRLLVAAQGLFKLSINEELARGKIELGSLRRSELRGSSVCLAS